MTSDRLAHARDDVPWLVAEVARLRAENAEMTEKLAALREHTLDSNPALRQLHANAVAYIDAVHALSEARGGAPLSTTLAWMIRNGYLVTANQKRAER